MIHVNARAIIERTTPTGTEILVQVRNKPHEGGTWIELPGGRVEEFESIIDALRREVREETGLELTEIEGLSTRIETGDNDTNVECLAAFAVYQTIKGPVDSLGVYFRCKATGQLLSTGDDTESIQWVSVESLAAWLEEEFDRFSWVDRAGLNYYVKEYGVLSRPADWQLALVVSLHAVVNEMDVLSDEEHAYLNRESGKLVTIRDEEIRAIEERYDLKGYPDWQQELLEKTQEVLDSDDYLPLPSKFDIHEYAIMERFCYSIEDDGLSEELIYQIKGSGAFRRFKNAIHRHGIEDQWYRYRQRALEEIAIDWLEARGIAYTRGEESTN